MNTKKRIEDLAEACQNIDAASEVEERDLSRSERKKIEENLVRTKGLRAQLATEEQICEVGIRIGLNNPESDGQPPSGVMGAGGTPGQAFVGSEGYKRIQNPAARSSRWSSGKVEVPYRTKANELFEGELGNPGTGGPLVQPDVQSGVVPTLFQMVTVADAIPSVSVISNRVKTIVESVATSGAAVVPEGGDKPASILEFDEVDEPVKKIATHIPVSDELLSDSGPLASYLNARLALFVRMEEEAQLVGGQGGDNLLGLLPRIPAENKFVVSDADTPNAADHVYEAIATAERAFLPAEVVVTTAVPIGYGVVGAFGTAAQVYRRGGLTVEASNSHSDWFVKDQIAVRAEVRVGLGVLRPASFAVAVLGGAS